MDFSKFFIDRPIFAAVLSIVIFAAGLIALPLLPISEYPDVVPPSVQVRAMYPGANPKEISETVATPLEEAINGVENMMYMKSVAGSDGVLLMTVTFRPGTDPDAAQVNVQNRVSQSLSRLPEAVVRQGVTTQKQSPNFTMVINLVSPGGTYNSLYLRNYATLKIKDELARLPGVGQALVFGSGDYAMRIWLDPDKIASRGLTAGDVLRAVREQNLQVSAGQLGAEPLPTDSDFLISINARGRLQTEQEFGDVVIKAGDDGEVVRLADVARVELGASDYTLRAQLNNKESVAIGVFQAPGANALEIADAVRAKMDELATRFPSDMGWTSVYNTTVFVRDSINAVISTLLEAVVLVVLVVILFLQTWRASIIPLIAVPVSIVGTFAVLYLLGFSINTLSLFGMVLAIGIVVDDAIVVVENVERNIEEGLSPLAAAHQAMREVSGPIVAIALVLCAVFVPMAFLEGVIGQFYKQFAVTIAISTVISAINSLTLSPALAALLLRGHDAPKDMLSRLIDRVVRLAVPAVQPLLQGELERLPGRRLAHAAPARLGVRGLRAAARGGRLHVPDRAGRLHPEPGQGVPDQRRQIAGRRVAVAHRRGAAPDHRCGADRRRRRQRGLVPRPQCLAVHQHAQHRRVLHRAQAVRPAPPQRGGDQRRDQPEDRRHQGRLRLRLPAAAGVRAGQRLGLFALCRGPRRARLRRLAERARRAAGHGHADAGHDLPDQHLSVQRAAARAAGRPRQGQGARRGADRSVRDRADLSRLGLCQRLQPVRPDFSGARPGRRAVPRQRRGHRQAAYPQRQGRDGADRLDGAGSTRPTVPILSCATMAIRPST